MTGAGVLTATERARVARLRADLARHLTDQGHLADPAWREAFLATPRHVFVPSFFEPDGRGDWRLVDGADPAHRDHWLRSVYSDETLIIALAEILVSPAGPGTVFRQWTSSSTAPGLVLSMLRALDVADGHRVLEIGTGSGYHAGLLCARLGSASVASVDVDPELVDAAGERLASLGHTPTLRAVDGSGGLPERAPYDRLIATCAVRVIPRPWLDQVTPGGVILTDLRGRIGGTVVAVRKLPDGTATGRFLPEWAGFMVLRHAAVPGPPAGPAPDLTGTPRRRTTSLDPNVLLDDPRVAFFLQWHLPGGRLTRTARPPAIRLTTPDGSWCEVRRVPRSDARHHVVEAGPRRLWSVVESAHSLWLRLDTPGWDRFGITVTDQGQRVWLDTPDSPHTWPLPSGDDPSPEAGS